MDVHVGLGRGITNNQVALDTTVGVGELATFLTNPPPAFEKNGWVMMPKMKDGRRIGTNFVSADGTIYDLDFRDADGNKLSSDPFWEAIFEAWQNGDIPGSLLWRTPHGVKIVWLFDRTVTDRAAYLEIWRANADAIYNAVRKAASGIPEIRNDTTANTAAKLHWLPNTTITDKSGGVPVPRRSKVYESPGGPRQYRVSPDFNGKVEKKHGKRGRTRRDEAREMIGAALMFPEVQRWADLTVQNRDGECPACYDVKGGPTDKRLKRMMDGDEEIPNRFICHGESHNQAKPCLGKKPTTGSGWVIDTVDLAAYMNRRSQQEIVNACLEHPDALDPESAPPPPAEMREIFTPQPGFNGKTDAEFADEILDSVPPLFYAHRGDVVVMARNEAGEMMPIGSEAVVRGGQTYLGAVAKAIQFKQERRARTAGAKNHEDLTPMTAAVVGSLVAGVRVLAAAGDKRVLPLRAVTRIPMLRPNGSWTSKGYDPVTQTYYDEPAELVGLHPRRGLGKKERAAIIDRFLGASRNVLSEDSYVAAVAFLLTAVLRPLFVGQPCPIFALTAPDPGLGKTTLAKMVEVIVSGTARDGVLYDRNPRLLSERITAYLISTPCTTLLLDNLPNGKTFNSELFCRFSTATEISDRAKYDRGSTTFPNVYVPVVTGNAIGMSADISTRAIEIRFEQQDDAKPWVEVDPLAFALKMRREVLEVVLGLVSSLFDEYGYDVLKWPGHSTPEWKKHYARFPAWGAVVMTALDHCGFSGTFVSAAREYEDEDSVAVVEMLSEIMRVGNRSEWEKAMPTKLFDRRIGRPSKRKGYRHVYATATVIAQKIYLGSKSTRDVAALLKSAIGSKRLSGFTVERVKKDGKPYQEAGTNRAVFVIYEPISPDNV